MYIKDYKKLESDYMAKFKNMASEPVALFKEDGTFNPDNWNGLDLLRHYALKVYEGDIENDAVKCWFDDDYWFAVFNVDFNTTILMRWYKSRGRTELITCNNHPCTITEYVRAIHTIIEEN